MSEPARGLHEDLDEMVRATDRLLATVDAMTEDALAGASLLPGWTRGHVLTHVARNADALVNLAHWARTGDETPMYPGDAGSRDRDIEAGAGRRLGDHRLDLADSAERLLAAFAGFPHDGLDREVRMRSGASVFGWEIPRLRTREVEIHHVDLGLSYAPADWPAEFATRTLDQLAPLFREARECPVAVLVGTDVTGRWEVAPAGPKPSGPELSGPELSGPVRDLAAWLTGRSRGDGLTLSPAGEVPPAPRWA